MFYPKIAMGMNSLGDVVGPYSPLPQSHPVQQVISDVRIRNHRTAMESLELLADYVDAHAGTTSLNISEVAARIRDNLKLLRS